MKLALIAASVAAALTLSPALAQAKAPQQVISDTEAGAAKGSLAVSSTSFHAGGAIAQKYSGYGASTSPQLSWTPVPAARSYAVVVEDPDGPGPKPVVHWLAWNIPASVHSLPEGLVLPPGGMVQGTNSKQHTKYDGPHPPPGDPPHHYHFQVFALDRTLTLTPSANREGFVGQVAGHILAKGQLIGTYGAPSTGG